MIVRRVEIYRVRIDMKFEFETSVERIPWKECVLVKLKLDDVEGWGESPAGIGPFYSYEFADASALVIKKYLAPAVVGREFSRPEEFRAALERVRGWNMAKHALESAFWDAYCKFLGVPLYRALGGVRTEITSGVSIGLQPTVEDLLKEVEAALDKYARIKIKIKPGADVELVKAIRDHFGDIPLQVDANGAYTLAHADVFRELDKYDLLMIEQPLAWDDLVEHAELQKMLSTPICLDESVKSPADAVAAAVLGSCKVINIKPARVGGILAAVKIHDICKERGIGTWIGGMLETGVGRAVLAHLATLPNVVYPNDITEPTRYLAEDIVEPELSVEHGRMKVPSDHGIGVSVVEERLKRYTQRVWIVE